MGIVGNFDYVRLVQPENLDLSMESVYLTARALTIHTFVVTI